MNLLKRLFNDEAGVSPIVATLVLVVVAIAGAAAVGTIMGSFSSDVSDSANADAAASSAATELLVAGSSTVQPVSDILAKGYMAEHPGVKITVQGGGSSAGIASAGLGVIDIGAASKFIPDASMTKFPDLQEHVIGGSAVVVIVNKPFTTAYPGVHNISQAELEAIYDDVAGAITINTTAMSSLVSYQRTEGSGTEETFAGFAVDADDVDDAVDNVATTQVQANAIGNQGVLDAVAGNTKPAIGFVDYGFAASEDDVTMLAIGAGKTSADVPTSSSVKAEVKARLADAGTAGKYEYDLCRPLVYVTNGEPSSIGASFIQYAMSPASIEAFGAAGYYSITELQ
ncbi:substrate-binding domain-containing protein [uncultured Methanolobus sp.]|uniref:substrate-binding domain-containing protein n=1 Tax=uncultured Methanolobus sp. TaxID=218300 RepID=UPI0029C62BEA|nr:substrate-binding domain-containing protein [uncultured Methanolobus sp.]